MNLKEIRRSVEGWTTARLSAATRRPWATTSSGPVRSPASTAPPG